MRWPNQPIRTNRLFGVSKGLKLRFERLVVLAFDLKFGLEFLHLKIETRDLGTGLCEMGAALSLLRRRRSRVEMRSVLVRIRETTVNRLRRLRWKSRSCWRRIRLKSLSRRIRENWWGCE